MWRCPTSSLVNFTLLISIGITNLKRYNAFSYSICIFVLNRNFKISAHPDLATQLLQVHIPNTSIILLCQKGNIDFSHVCEDGLLGKYLVITPKKFKLKITHDFLLPVQKEGFQGTARPKTGWTGPGQVPKNQNHSLDKS